MRQADASDVSESISVLTSPVAPLQPELSAENRQHNACRDDSKRPIPPACFLAVKGTRSS
eukprot:6360279-Pyramimonas_sp.AAC.1